MLDLCRYTMNLKRGRIFSVQFRFMANRPPKIDKSKVPKLDEKDLEEHFVSGSGPGGQSVNKAVNCCNLKHIPTGIHVKVHHTRSLDKNREIARELLISRLDNLYNGENSVENQKRRIALEKLSIKKAQQENQRKMKEEFKKSTSQSKTETSIHNPPR